MGAAEVTIRAALRPWPHQRAAHLARQRWTVVVWHRRAGKTVWAIQELIESGMAAARTDARYVYLAPLYRQAKQVAWDYLRQFTAQIPGRLVRESELSVELPTGAQIRLCGADNPDSLRGIYLDGVVLDEVAQMRPEVWGEIVRPALADRHGWAVFIGTPKGVNLFSELYFAALNDPQWHADLRRWCDTGVLDAAEIESMRRDMSEPEWAQEMECDFSAAVANTLISLSLAREAAQRVVVERDLAHAPKIIGVDPARYGDDRSVIVRRHGLLCLPPRTFRGLDLMQLSGCVAAAIDEWHPDAVFVDGTGLGAGVVDRLRQLGHSVVDVQFGAKALNEKYQNRRAEMWAKMADWIRDGGAIPNDPALIADLCAPTYSYANAAGRFALESKDDMRDRGLPSPDCGDALALTFAAPVVPRGRDQFGFPRQQKKSDVWHPADNWRQRHV